MKVAFICTVLNEERDIDKLLSSLNGQTRSPDEAIIVDGGSSDKTIQKINSFNKARSTHIKIKVIKKKGNRSLGRNTAIKASKSKYIVCTDAGCTLEKYWLSNIIKGFEDGVDVVAGYYKPIAKNTFEKCLATYTSTMSDKIDENNFLPSSRSIAFTKSAWKRVGGYPEWLDYSEDLYFSNQLVKKDLKFQFMRNAIVYWPQRKNIFEASRQFYLYAIGDGISRYIRPSTPMLFGRYLVGLILVLLYLLTNSLLLIILICTLFANYILFSIFKNYRYVNEKKAWIYLPLLQFSADFSVLTGMSIGFLKSFFIKK